jgi:uncharacterized protein (DUF924 family)
MVKMQALPAQALEVLDFWFGGESANEPREAWFRKDPAFDERIRQRFGGLIEAALAGGLREWHESPGGALARVVVLDQFTRNTFRDSARAFAGDALALQAAQEVVARGWDLLRPPVQRQFIYLPFEHSESLAMQDESMRLFSALAVAHPASADGVIWAGKHRDIIVRFGRFPHRNQALGRASTAEEEAFLQQPGSRF